MKFLIFLTLVLASAAASAGENVGIQCSTHIEGKTLEVSYSASKSRMELTRSADGTLFGSSFDGTLILNLNGVEILNQKADAAAEEYGVIVQGDQLLYANLNVEDEAGDFSNEGSFFITFGKSFDERSPSYTTDSKRKEIGGGRKFPKTFPAICKSL